MAPLLAWSGLSVGRFVQQSKGDVATCQLVAVLGPSGCGKTTLVRTLHGSSAHSVPVSGAWTRTPGYAGLVEQDDLPVLAGTVQEVVEFYARIKPPAGDKSAGLSTWRQRADRALQAMGLTHVRTSKVRTLSGGERRRLSVAVELVSQPSILFMDEPTSGLSSADAMLMIAQVRRAAEELHMGVLLTIHQPRQEIYDMFDRVILMAAGTTVFVGSPSQSRAFFASPSLLDLPPDQHACVTADVISDLLYIASSKGGDHVAAGGDMPKAAAGIKGAETPVDNWNLLAQKTLHRGLMDRATQLVTQTPSMGLGTAVLHIMQSCGGQSKQGDKYLLDPLECESLSKSSTVIESGSEATEDPPCKQPSSVEPRCSWLLEVWLLLCRQGKRDLTSFSVIGMRLAALAVLTGVYVLLFWNAETNYNIMAALVFIVPFLSMSTILVAHVVLDDYKLLSVDLMGKKYRLSSYLCSSTLLASVQEVVCAMIFVVSVYYAVGFRPGTPYIGYALLMGIMTALTASAMVLMCTAALKKLAGVIACIAIAAAYCMLTCGFFKRYGDVQPGLQWLYTISFWNMAVNGLAINQFRDMPDRCESDALRTAGLCLLDLDSLSGNDILYMYKFKYTDKWAPIAAMTVVLVVLTILRAILLALLSTSTWRLRLTSIARSITPWTRTPVYSSAHADTGDGGSECSSDSKGRRKIRPYVAAAWATLVALVAILITMGFMVWSREPCDSLPWWQPSNMDGSCMDRARSDSGKAGLPLTRIPTTQSYTVCDPLDPSLPNPREVSDLLLRAKPETANITEPRGTSVMHLAIFQFLAHDLVHAEYDYTRKLRIPVPRCDKAFDKDCTGKQHLEMFPITGYSEGTAWLDMDPVYGSSKEQSDSVREFQGGRLKLTADGYLPSPVEECPHSVGTLRPAPGMPPCPGLARTADMRNHGNVLLQSYITMWAREHNRWANLLAARHPEYDDERLFHSARAINILIYIRLSFITAVTGYATVPEHISKVASEIFDERGRSPSNEKVIEILTKDAARYFAFDFTVLAKVGRAKRTQATADVGLLYRLHGLIPDQVSLADPITQQVTGNYSLVSTAYKDRLVRGYNLDQVMMGALITHAKKEAGPGYVSSLLDIPYSPSQAPLTDAPGYQTSSAGFDLGVADLVRARELCVGRIGEILPRYAQPPLGTFADITPDTEKQAIMKRMYGSVDKVEVPVVAALQERAPGMLLSLTKWIAITRGGLVFGIGHAASAIKDPELIALAEDTGVYDIFWNSTNIRCIPRMPVLAPHPIDNPYVCKA